MSVTEHLTDNPPRQTVDPDPGIQRGERGQEDQRKENAAKYKENVHQVNRARDIDMERALGGAIRRAARG